MSNSIENSGPIGWMASNPIAANLLFVLAILMGFIAIKELPKEVFPSFPPEQVTVTVPYPGSSPEEVERGILIKVEEAIRDVIGIKEIRSVARESVGVVTVQMLPGTDMGKAVNEIKMRVDSIAAFPLDAEKAIVAETIYRGAGIFVTVSADIDIASLKELTYQIREELLQIEDVTEIAMLGDREYEISIEVSQQNLERYGLTFAEVAAAIRKQSRDLPGGQMRTESGTIKLRSESQAYTGPEFEKIPLIARPDGTFIFIGDVATVIDAFNEKPVLSIIDGKPAMTLMVQQVGNQDVLQIVRQVREYVDDKRGRLSDDITLSTWVDQTRILQSRIDMMLDNAVQGAALVVIVLALFLDLTLAFWVILGVPFAMLATLGSIYVLGMPISINILSVFAFILVLGILVDDGIVTAESAYAKLQEDRNGLKSVVSGVRRVAVSTTFGALTTMIAFMPTLLINEGFGRALTQLGPVVIFCILFSLIETKLILPSHLRHVNLDKKERGWLKPFYRLQNICANGLTSFAQGPYKRVLSRAVSHRYTTLAIFLSGFIIVAAFIPSGWVRFVFFPAVPSDFISANLEMPEGTSWRETYRLAERIEKAALAMDEKHQQQDLLARSAIKNLFMISSSDTSAQVFLELTPSEERDIDAVQLSNWLREALGPLEGARSFIINDKAGPPGLAPLEVELSGKSLDKLRAAAEQVKIGLQSIDGVFDVRDSFNAGGTEFNIQVTPEGQSLGLGNVDLASQVRQAFYGMEVQRVQRGRDEIRVFVRLDRNDRSMLGAINDLWIRLPNGTSVPFPVVGRIEEYSGLSVINRIDMRRVVTVSANFDKSKVEPGEVINVLRSKTIAEVNNNYPDVRVDFGGEAEQQSNTSDTLGLATLFVLILIYSALAIPLKSYTQPLLIMSVIPFGVVGAFAGHWLMGLDLSILSIIGIIGLIGVVVNDSLVMVDFVNHYKAAGHAWREAVLKAGPTRFRAVFLTSLTTFVGLAPIQLEKSLQAQFVKPMATSLAFGILFSTVVTLILIPVLYFVGKDIQHWLKRLFGMQSNHFKELDRDTH
ncbi:MAG TPA: efflux RND transporter permease subunit [Pseudomonadales bacterium]|nr:efflux RND transporter permease subunit [Pseudomonadales bacterium]